MNTSRSKRILDELQKRQKNYHMLQTVILLFWKRDTNLVDFTNNN